MGFEVHHILIACGILAFIVEIFTIGFVAGSIGIGLFFAAIGNYYNLSLEWQILLFSLGVILTFFVIRPLVMKYGYSKEAPKTNQDALIDKIGKVTEEINNQEGTGRVSIDGDDWKAVSENNDIIEVGNAVRVIKYESIILTVKKLN